MESLSPDSVRKAFSLYMNLIEKSKITKKDDPEGFLAFEDPEISFITRIFEEEAGIMILRSGDTLYFTPRTDNKFLGFTNEELRDKMGFSNNSELYISYLIILSIIIKFYNGENYNNKVRSMLKVEELEGFITLKLESFKAMENGEQKDEELNFNFSTISRLWLELPTYDEKIKSFSQSKGTKISFIYRTLKFLQEQGLINMDNDSEIYTTEKLDTMVISYYPESSRKKEILSFLERI
ncbi:DUF6063 family protein [Pseudobacteroides cellulosolvens]|uniref:Uncharacterized protein n=1 Tax=Pseudobacteroides cellulosolvens ATCC 35603 = DSM 2933 TaxID=398512 RepID=A0A0L6JL34_9FIRM|nr:DUF6063 family protein [Pseudobacteroides cellulosolvens]KNY26536.1 hypothetical protein Bccel_1801 [Pseudobacteroides cellulosolvens ATCC 35603 = DSM 2933]